MTPAVRDGLVAVTALTAAIVWLAAGPYVVGVERNIAFSAAVALGGAFAFFMGGGLLIMHLQSRDEERRND